MRWKRLFCDVEAQLAEVDRLELEDEVAERVRDERRNVHLVDRLRSCEGALLDVRTVGAGQIRGQLRQVGADWMLLGEEAGAELLIPMAATLSVCGVGSRVVVPTGGAGVLWRASVRYALSVISRDRSAVRVTLTDGSMVNGTIDAVAADHVDMAPAVDGEARWGRGRTVSVSVPLGGLAVVRRTS
ncbi:hypothetical protein [Phytoactinopolyspora limicola]|uniref:hypothetical protein n=1 Tax=Phytoactinopolyspora limicola TaxID=2715536 RepID=UPI00140CAEE4|nr:hypothetical protein [Phytoactinopolyspora limicola]